MVFLAFYFALIKFSLYRKNKKAFFSDPTETEKQPKPKKAPLTTGIDWSCFAGSSRHRGVAPTTS
jgi:hypothetical protein